MLPRFIYSINAALLRIMSGQCRSLIMLNGPIWYCYHIVLQKGATLQADMSKIPRSSNRLKGLLEKIVLTQLHLAIFKTSCKFPIRCKVQDNCPTPYPHYQGHTAILLL